MAIPDDDVTAVRSATDILALIGEYTPLKRVGRRYVGLCPFHAEKTGSFSVNAEEGLYYCFGCQASGDAITFLRNIEGCDFVEAVERLATRAGIAIRHDAGGKDRPDREGRKALLEVMERAVAFYHEELLSQPDAKRARQYLRSRGYQGEIVRQFGLGWAPETGRSLVGAVRAPADLLVKAGLAHQGQNGLRDAFRGRVIFPIFDPAGKAIGLGGRILPGAGEGAGPKYRNSPETPDLLEKTDPLRAQLGQTFHRPDRRSDHLRGVHRRHRLLHGRLATGSGDLRHGANRGTFPPPRAIRETGRARVRRRCRRSVRCRPLLRMGKAPRAGSGRRRPAPRQ